MALLKSFFKFVREMFLTKRNSRVVAVDGKTCFIKTNDEQLGYLAEDGNNQVLPLGLNLSVIFYGCEIVWSYLYNPNGICVVELIYQDDERWLVKVAEKNITFYGFLYDLPEENMFPGKKVRADKNGNDTMCAWVPF